MNTVNLVKKHLNKELELEGAVLIANLSSSFFFKISFTNLS